MTATFNGTTAPGAHSLRSPDGASVEVHAYGAQLTRWIPAGESTSRLFLSGNADLSGRNAIRGGIPVIFPQFALEGPLPRHGFARTRQWRLMQLDDGGARLALSEDDASLQIWPYPFLAELHVRCAGDELSVSLAVHNTGVLPFAFTAALHSYLAVSDIGTASVHGLHGLHYRDSALGLPRQLERAATLTVNGELDRIYFDVPGPLTLQDGQRRLRVSSAGFPDAVVWNPGPAKAALLADLQAGGERHMLCIEAAAIGRPVQLDPGDSWAGTQYLQAT